MIISLLNTYYFISTTITTIIKVIISNTYNMFIQPLSWFLDFGFNGFVGLKIRR